MKNFLIRVLGIMATIATIPLNVHANEGVSKFNMSSLDEEIVLSRNPENEVADLAVLVGLPFAFPEKPHFEVHQANSKGEKVGIASFRNPNWEICVLEVIAWYWHPESGFRVITSRSELKQAYGRDIFKTLFQFGKLVINEKGIVAGFFSVDQIGSGAGSWNQFAWFWWSSEDGLQLSDLPSKSQILEGLNDNGFILLSHVTSLDFEWIIQNIYHPEDSQTYGFSPHSEFPNTFKDGLKDRFCDINYYGDGKPITTQFKWYPFTAKYFDNDLKIIGQGSCNVTFVRGITIKVWAIKIGCEINNGKVMFFVKEIEDRTNPHGGASCTFGDKQYMIYENEL